MSRETPQGRGAAFHRCRAGDVNPVKVGRNVSIQDNAIVQNSRGHPMTVIGDDVVIGACLARPDSGLRNCVQHRLSSRVARANWHRPADAQPLVLMLPLPLLMMVP